MKTYKHIAPGILSLLVITLFPLLAVAGVTDVFSAARLALTILSALAGTLFTLAVALFFWGLVKFIMNTSDTKAHEDGKKFIVWGLVSLFVISTLWTIVGFFMGDFGLTFSSVGYIYSR